MGDQVTGLLSNKLRAERIKAAIPYLNGMVLDVGCGTGSLASKCNPNMYHGCDIDAQSIAIAKELHPNHSFSQEVPKEGSYDTIVMLAVIEHVPSPSEFLSQFKPLLSQKGSIVLTTPHKNAEWMHALGASIGLFSSSAKEEHEVLFNHKLMIKTAAQAGLQVTLYKRFLFGVNQVFVLGAM